MKNKLKLIKVGILRDGGSYMLVEAEDYYNIKSVEDAQSIKKYYQDFKYGSKTKGEYFLGYPGDKDSVQLDKETIEIIKDETTSS